MSDEREEELENEGPQNDSADEKEQDEVNEFSLVFEEVPITIADAKGVKRQYVLRDIDGVQRGTHTDLMLGRTRWDKEGKPAGAKSLKGIQADLIHRCLWDDAGKQVSEKEIESWPSKVSAALYMKCLKLTGLDKEAEERAKNA